jgi:uncharacterized protein
MRQAFELGGRSVAPGTAATIDLPISRLSTHTEITLPVRVVHGAKPGPVLFVSASIHGDEIIGVEIIRRLLTKIGPRKLAGTLLCIPIVNVFGFVAHTRYLPDRRDLNRCFPGSKNGPLALQLAHVFTQEIVNRSQYGIDLHSAAVHRHNHPQIRIDPDKPKVEELAAAFGPPVIITVPGREGSLRQAAGNQGVHMLLFEAGEALRFDEFAVRVGVKGVLRVMEHVGMATIPAVTSATTAPVRSERTHWLRAPHGGIFRAIRASGDKVNAGDTLGYVSDPFGDKDVPLTARANGVIIGRSNLPSVNQGDALMHIAEVAVFDTVSERMDQIHDDALSDPMFDDDDII